MSEGVCARFVCSQWRFEAAGAERREAVNERLGVREVSVKQEKFHEHRTSRRACWMERKSE